MENQVRSLSFLPTNCVQCAVIIIKFHTEIICSFWHFSRFISLLVLLLWFHYQSAMVVLDASTILFPLNRNMPFRFLFALQSQYDTKAVVCCWRWVVIWQEISYEKKPDPSLFSFSFTPGILLFLFNLLPAQSRFSANLICLDIKGVNTASRAIKGWTFYSKINLEV